MVHFSVSITMYFNTTFIVHTSKYTNIKQTLNNDLGTIRLHEFSAVGVLRYATTFSANPISELDFTSTSLWVSEDGVSTCLVASPTSAEVLFSVLPASDAAVNCALSSFPSSDCKKKPKKLIIFKSPDTLYVIVYTRDMKWLVCSKDIMIRVYLRVHMSLKCIFLRINSMYSSSRIHTFLKNILFKVLSLPLQTTAELFNSNYYKFEKSSKSKRIVRPFVFS